MIGYVILGSNDKEKAKAFYDDLLALLGAKSFAPNDRLLMWSTAPGKPILAVGTPYDGNTASVGNGTMVALNVENQENVDKLYHKAIELGAADEGEPGFRTDAFYGAYFRDPDGNKLAVYYMK